MTAITPREAIVPIYQGDDLFQLASLDDKVGRAKQKYDLAKKAAQDGNAGGLRMLAETPADVEAAQAYQDALAERDAFAAAAEDRAVKVALHAQPRKKWRELMREHPARPDVDEDNAFVVNMDTLPDVLLPASICRDEHCPSSHEPTTITGDTMAFLESLSDYDFYDRLFVTAFALNRGSAMADPTQRLLSGSSQTSAATSS